jgi:hypothetical protein
MDHMKAIFANQLMLTCRRPPKAPRNAPAIRGRWTRTRPTNRGASPVEHEATDDWPETDIQPGTTAMSVVVVGELETRQAAAAVAVRLAEVAVNDELLVIYGSDERVAEPGAQEMVAGLRGHLPRHDIVALNVTPHSGAMGRHAAVVDEYLEIGSLPVVVTPVASVRELTVRFSDYLRADRVLSMTCTTGGADLREVWHRDTTDRSQLAYLGR